MAPSATLGCGEVPADKARTWPARSWLRMASAICERQAFPVHSTSTVFRSVMVSPGPRPLVQRVISGSVAGSAGTPFLAGVAGGGQRQAGLALAAVVGQEIDQPIHPRKIGRVVDEAVRPLPLDQPDAAQMREVKRGRSRRHGQRLTDR